MEIIYTDKEKIDSVSNKKHLDEFDGSFKFLNHNTFFPHTCCYFLDYFDSIIQFRIKIDTFSGIYFLSLFWI